MNALTATVGEPVAKFETEHADVPHEVVDHRGRPALRITTTTPAGATVADLLFIRRLLDEAGIAFLLVRTRGERPVLAVDAANVVGLEAALAAGCATEPFYVKVRERGGFGAAQRISEDWVGFAPTARALRVFRRRVEPRSGLVYGSSTAVQIELWRFGAEFIDLPSPNILTRRRVDARQLVGTTVEAYGQHWPTIDGMFTPDATEVSFDIDLVFSWVDGSSSDFQAARAKRMRSYVVGDDDRSSARYRHIDELRYALRSIHMYAPWVRRIFIATDSDRPPWLAEDPRVTIIRSSEFFQDPRALPTHNSHGVESQLHHIPGLSEHFIYSNDDMFFGRPVAPTMFFSSGSVSRFIESNERIGLGGTDQAQSGFENAARVNRQILGERFGKISTRHLAHAPTPLRRSVLDEMEQEFSAQFRATAASPFRSMTDISVTNSLYHYYALLTGRATLQEQARVAYLDTTVRADLEAMDRLLRRRNTDFFCLNDGGRVEVGPKRRMRRVTRFLERYFPIPAPWEAL